MASREEKKAEARLKALLKEPGNKRCINCDALVRGGGGGRSQPGPGCPLFTELPSLPPPPRAAGPPICRVQLQRLRVHRVQRRAVSGTSAAHPPPAAAAGAAAWCEL